MTAPPAPHVQVSGLSVSLGSRRVLTNLSCALERGTFVGLIGPNGSGKSTLLKAIMGLLQSTGSIRLDGEDLLAIPHKLRAQRIAYLAQDSEVVWPIAVEDLVMLGRSPHRSGFAPPQAADVEAVDRAIREMDLEALRKRSARELSGGERARALISRVLAQDTPVVLADEPTAGLDPEHQIALMEVFRRMARQGRTVLASLHDLALAAQWCDHLLLLDQGRIVAAGTPEEVLTPDTLASVYRVRAHFGKSDAGPLVVPIARLKTIKDTGASQ
ncbi:MAG: ABC transporter ATP-binding protein [Hyphomicrobiaceae bacterium]